MDMSETTGGWGLGDRDWGLVVSGWGLGIGDDGGVGTGTWIEPIGIRGCGVANGRAV